MNGCQSRSGWLAVVGLAALSFIPTLQAEEFYGPLRNRDMGPVGFSRLHMLPDHAIPPADGRFAVELHLSHSNTFAMDKETKDYLEARGGRQDLTQADVDNIFALGGDSFLFDASLSLAQMTVHYGFNDHWSIYGSIPYYRYGGGSLDPLIEEFHDAFGFSTFGRQYIPRGQVNAVVSLGGEQLVLLDAPGQSGLGDPVIGLRYHRFIGERTAITVELAHKEVFQDEKFFRTTGGDDTGVQLNWQRFGDVSAIHVSASIVKIGSAEPFPSRTRSVLPKLNVAWERKLGERLNLILQANAQKSLFRDGTDPEISSNVYQASVGLRQRHGEFVWSYALTENLINFNNTADLGFHIGFAWSPAY